MIIDIVSIFPEYLEPLSLSLVGKAQETGKLTIRVHDLRDWSAAPHHRVDDTPYGGGPGMVMDAPTWGRALDEIAQSCDSKPLLVVPTPSGKIFDQPTARSWAGNQSIVIACARYEGIDSRVSQHYQNRSDWEGVQEVSIGNYVLAGGEAAALVMVETVARLIPGVLGNPESAPDDTFSRADGLLEGSVYTKPPTWRDLEVPPVLLSGNHQAIDQWRAASAEEKTRNLRPDLLS